MDLIYACRNQNIDKVKFLLKNKERINPNIDTRGTDTSPRECRYSKGIWIHCLILGSL